MHILDRFFNGDVLRRYLKRVVVEISRLHWSSREGCESRGVQVATPSIACVCVRIRLAHASAKTDSCDAQCAKCSTRNIL